MRVKIRLDTVTDIANFVLVASTVAPKVLLKNDDGLCVDGKSFLGVAHASEFKNLWCECEKDIYSKIEPFVIVGSEEEGV